MTKQQKNTKAPRSPRRTPWLLYIAAVTLLAGGTIAILLLMENIAMHKREAEQVVLKIVELDEDTVDPEQWAKNFPRQYDSYKRTVDTVRTTHGGSDAFQRLDEYPRWRTIFAGYSFAVDYREERGHAYMLSDQRETERVAVVDQPGACLHCHASNIPAYRRVGIEHGAPGDIKLPLEHPDAQAQLMLGFEKICAMPYQEATQLVDYPVTCLDCHDPDSLQLRVTRPAFINGIRLLAASEDDVFHLPSIGRWRAGSRSQPYNPNELASRQEMRTLVCAQCHVEYYFKGEGKLLTYPWREGLKVEQEESYYDRIGFSDWTHEMTKSPVLKAQHPEFELWSQGIHARAGVACADCHMPYKREGAIKISDHHVRSPLLNIARACQTCHNVPESELLARALAIQKRTRGLMDRAEKATVDLINAIDLAMKEGMADAQLEDARQLQRKAQWRLDFIFAENSMGFHASQEAARILGEAIDFARQGQILVAMQTP